eukprot:5508524-Prymnesium_polylepis.1
MVELLSPWRQTRCHGESRVHGASMAARIKGSSRRWFETGRWGAGAAAGAAEGKFGSGWAAAWRFRTL